MRIWPNCLAPDMMPAIALSALVMLAGCKGEPDKRWPPPLIDEYNPDTCHCAVTKSCIRIAVEPSSRQEIYNIRCSYINNEKLRAVCEFDEDRIELANDPAVESFRTTVIYGTFEGRWCIANVERQAVSKRR